MRVGMWHAEASYVWKGCSQGTAYNWSGFIDRLCRSPPLGMPLSHPSPRCLSTVPHMTKQTNVPHGDEIVACVACGREETRGEKHALEP